MGNRRPGQAAAGTHGTAQGSGVGGTCETGGGMLYSSGAVLASGSAALGAFFARFLGRAAEPSRCRLPAAMPLAPRRARRRSHFRFRTSAPLPVPPVPLPAAMPLTAQPAGSAEPYVLSASLDNARHLSSLLRAVHFQDHATCFATANGLRVTVEDAKCIQANAFIQVRPGGRAAPPRART